MANLSNLEIKINPENVQEAINLLNDQMRIFEYSYSTIGVPIMRINGAGCAIPTINAISSIYDDMLGEVSGLYHDTIQLLNQVKDIYESADSAAQSLVES